MGTDSSVMFKKANGENFIFNEVCNVPYLNINLIFVCHSTYRVHINRCSLCTKREQNVQNIVQNAIIDHFKNFLYHLDSIKETRTKQSISAVFHQIH